MTKSIPITLDKKRNLRYDWAALETIEETLGISLADIGNKLAGSVQLSFIKTLVWAGLLHEDGELTLEDVRGFLDLSRIAEYATAVGEAFTAAFPAPSKDATAKN